MFSLMITKVRAKDSTVAAEFHYQDIWKLLLTSVAVVIYKPVATARIRIKSRPIILETNFTVH